MRQTFLKMGIRFDPHRSTILAPFRYIINHYFLKKKKKKPIFFHFTYQFKFPLPPLLPCPPAYPPTPHPFLT